MTQYQVLGRTEKSLYQGCISLASALANCALTSSSIMTFCCEIVFVSLRQANMTPIRSVVPTGTHTAEQKCFCVVNG